MPIYVDTSALAKRYVLEQGSDAFDAFLRDCEDDCVISPLGTTEFESVLQRLRRQGYIDAAFARQARNDFLADLNSALWAVRPFASSSFSQATELMRSLDTPLATLDALHLASALEFGCDSFATSDRQLSRAASKRGLTVHDFSE
jgi:uncharacterized protein